MGSHGWEGVPIHLKVGNLNSSFELLFHGKVLTDLSLRENSEKERSKLGIPNIRIKITSKPFQIRLQSCRNFSIVKSSK